MTYYHGRRSSLPSILQKLLVQHPNKKKGKIIPKCSGLVRNKSLLWLLCYVVKTSFKFYSNYQKRFKSTESTAWWWVSAVLSWHLGHLPDLGSHLHALKPEVSGSLGLQLIGLNLAEIMSFSLEQSLYLRQFPLYRSKLQRASQKSRAPPPYCIRKTWKVGDRISLLPDTLRQPISFTMSCSQERFHHSRSCWRMICVLHPSVCL